MKKLRIKVFYTIFIILTLFSFLILTILNYQDYKRTKIKIEDIIHRMDSEENQKNDIPHSPKRFIDSDIYTIILEDDKIISIISHTADEKINKEIEYEANKIIKKTDKNNIHISNLYKEKYSYSYKNGIIILVDNTQDTKKLLTTLSLSIVLFLIAGIISYIISSEISRWITKPVEESFNKQKQFIADASHELKTPLAVIIASSESIEENKNNKKWLDNIKNESDRMNNLIQKLLTLAKTENKKEEYEMIDLSKTVKKEVFIMESLLYEKNIKLNYNISENIFYKCSADDIKQVLSILLDNAIKHSSKNGNIKVNLVKEKQKIILEVINRGDAIKKEDEEKIFERFYRVDKSRSRADNRYGLGLAIAKSIVNSYKGIITAHSKDGYTVFKIIFKN